MHFEDKADCIIKMKYTALKPLFTDILHFFIKKINSLDEYFLRKTKVNIL